MRRTLGISLVAGIVVTAIVVSQRMSSDAMAVMIGVVFGVAASIPTSLLIAVALRGGRSREPSYRGGDYPPAPPPQIYVVNPGPSRADLGRPAQPTLIEPPPAYYHPASVRRYKVVGESEYWLDDADDLRD